ncbi:GNAT family N-acetyltransferase [Enterococcus sp. LJL128]|uniref:GNAT family N-acetyltransferase n=1 Tax=Enterococcus sp. LJL51 TaxID=3416656 RepID=UPI003CE71EDE
MVKYKINEPITVEQFKEIIQQTGLKRRLDDRKKLINMLKNVDFLMTAWEDEKLVGFARGFCDFGSIVYVAELGVHKDYWKQGIGRKLMEAIVAYVGTDIHIVLLASKLAENYYSKLGFDKDPRGYVKLPEPLHPDDWQV